MGKSIPPRHFGNGSDRVRIQYHDGSSAVSGYILRQLGPIKYLVTTDGVTTYEVTLAQTTSEATTLTVGKATIALTPYGKPTEYIRRLQSNVCYTTAGGTYGWTRGTNNSPGIGQISTIGTASITDITITSASLPSNSPQGTVVGILASVPAGASLAITDDSSGRFALVGNTLVRTATGTITNGQTYNVSLTATQGFATYNETITITATAPLLTDITLSANVIENAAVQNTVVGALTSTPAGATWTLTDDAGGRFAISSNNLVAGATARVAGTNYNVTVRGTLGSSTFDKTFSISTVCTITDITLAASSVAQASAQNTVVGALASVPAGATLSLTGTAGGRFAISGGNLVVGATALTIGSHTVTVQATSGNSSFSKSFEVTVFDNEVAWPFTFTLTQDAAGFGSSTMQGGETGTRYPSPMKQVQLDGGGTYVNNSTVTASGVLVSNRGVGGANSGGILSTVQGAPSRQQQSNIVFQLGGNYENDNLPVTTIIANAQVMANTIGHSRFIHCTKHPDNATFSGSIDWHRLRDITRKLRVLYPGRVDDPGLVFRNYNTGNSSDTIAQTADQIPPSLAADAAHPNGAGNTIIAKYCYEPYLYSRETGFPFVPNQRLFSGASTNQTNGGLVAVVERDTAQSLTGVTASIVGSSDFTATINGSNIEIRRSSATYMSNGYYNLSLKLVKGGISRTSIIQVHMGLSSPTGAKRTAIVDQSLIKEGNMGFSTSQQFSFAIGFKPMAGWDALATTKARTLLFNNGINVAVKQSNNMNIGCTLKNAAGTTIFSLDSPINALQKFDEASGLRWYFCSVDLTTGTRSVAVDANTAVTSGGTCTVGETINLFPTGNNTISYLFGGTASLSTINGSCLMEVAAVWMSPTFVDFTSTTTNRDKIRNAGTGASILNTTRGGDAPGVVNGASPAIWMEGPAGNFTYGLNLAQPSEYWDCADRVLPYTAN